MAGQKGDACWERDLFYMLACIKGFSFVWNRQVVTAELVSKCVGSAVMVSSNQSPRISCRNREYCLHWESDYDRRFV